MNAPLLAESMRLMGRYTAHSRTASNLERREGFGHPLARAHRNVGMDRWGEARNLFDAAFSEDTALWEGKDPRAPEDWLREGERAARCFELGLAFAESLETRARRRSAETLELRESWSPPGVRYLHVVAP